MGELVGQIGAVAGLAAVVGLVVLAALALSQARDVRRLREWAGRAPGQARLGEPPVALRAARRTTGHVALALVGLLAVGATATYGVIRLAGGGGADDASNGQAHRNGSSGKPKRSVVVVRPGTVTVAVLNATMVDGLAARLREQIAAAGFAKGQINVFSDQQLARSVVQYSPGRQAEANAVSRIVGISRLQPVTADSRALAGDATVIVIAGADKVP